MSQQELCLTIVSCKGPEDGLPGVICTDVNMKEYFASLSQMGLKRTTQERWMNGFRPNHLKVGRRVYAKLIRSSEDGKYNDVQIVNISKEWKGVQVVDLMS